MKKYLLIVLFLSIIVVWCAKQTTDTIDVNSISDLTTLQVMITQISEQVTQWTIDPEEAQLLLNQLQDKYLELTDTTQHNIEAQFETVQNCLSQKSITSYTLPLWAKKLGMTEPKDMELNKVLSKNYTNSEWYNSTILVYTWTYVVALQQAELIAKKANLRASKMFEQGQAIAKDNDVGYISGLDIDNLGKGMVYGNHDLLDTNIENLLSVSVDQDGTLIIETTKYK